MNLPFGLSLKNTLQGHFTFHNTVKEIGDIIRSIHAVEDLKHDPELLLLICNLIENTIIKNKWKIDKKELAISIHDDVFGDSDEEKDKLKSQIEFFYQNGKIKKTKWWKLLGLYILDWTKRTFL
jgi:hypothetical protein